MKEYGQTPPKGFRLSHNDIRAIILIAFVLIFGLFLLMHAMGIVRQADVMKFFPVAFAAVALVLWAGFRAVTVVQRRAVMAPGRQDLHKASGPAAPAASIVWVLVTDSMGILLLYSGIRGKDDPVMVGAGLIMLLVSGTMTLVFIRSFLKSRRSGAASKTDP